MTEETYIISSVVCSKREKRHYKMSFWATTLYSPSDSLEYFKPHEAHLDILWLPLLSRRSCQYVRHFSSELSDISENVCMHVCTPPSVHPKAHELRMCVRIDDTRPKEENAELLLYWQTRCTYDVCRCCKSCGGQLSHTDRELQSVSVKRLCFNHIGGSFTLRDWVKLLHRELEPCRSDDIFVLI